METYARFDDVPVDEAHTIGGAYDLDGAPVYFQIPADTPDHEISGMAFEAKHGRPPDDSEWLMLSMIQRHRPEPANVGA